MTRISIDRSDTPSTSPDPQNKRVLIYPVHRTSGWWRYVGQNMGWGESVVVSDLRGEGDISVVDDFYAELKRLRAQAEPTGVLPPKVVTDVIARCRLLRWLDPHLARCMALAMAAVMDRVLAQVRPRVVVSFPIDRYVSDVLERCAAARGIRHLELTTNVVPNMSMLLYRGALVKFGSSPAPKLVRKITTEIADPTFVPTYVRKKSRYTAGKFIRTLGYFRTRALAFKLISWAKRDPLNLHYMDAQPFLGHKCRWKDIRVVRLVNPNWRKAIEAFPRERRVMFALHLFPEASIDYWLRNVALIDHESLVVAAATAFSKAGFQVLVKDHPLQFGFRQTELIDRLLALPNVVFLPYDVSGPELISVSGASFSCTGTLGLQAALAGLKSVVTESYYANDEDFIVYRERSDVDELPQRVLAEPVCTDLQGRRERIIAELLRGSFEADFFSFQGFDAANPAPGAQGLALALGRKLNELIVEDQL